MRALFFLVIAVMLNSCSVPVKETSIEELYIPNTVPNSIKKIYWNNGDEVKATAKQLGYIQERINKTVVNPPSGKRLPKLGPDINIIMNNRHYCIIGRAVLCDWKTGDVWQFYEGQQILRDFKKIK